MVLIGLPDRSPVFAVLEVPLDRYARSIAASLLTAAATDPRGVPKKVCM